MVENSDFYNVSMKLWCNRVNRGQPQPSHCWRTDPDPTVELLCRLKRSHLHYHVNHVQKEASAACDLLVARE